MQTQTTTLLALSPTDSFQRARRCFTAKEKEVANHLMRGRVQKDIAAALGIAVNTVATHIEHIYEKSGVNSHIGFLNTALGPVECSDAIAETFHLTRREKQVTDLILAGSTNKQIATALGMSPDTASSHRTNILSKTGAHSAVELFLEAKSSQAATQPQATVSPLPASS